MVIKKKKRSLKTVELRMKRRTKKRNMVRRMERVHKMSMSLKRMVNIMTLSR
jgi:hypothetical protein